VLRPALDRLDAEARVGRPPTSIDRIVTYGPRACRLVLERYGDARTVPETRARLHDVLVRLNSGTDLGDETDAWRTWCTSVRADQN
jgi:hypothetical protein